MDAPSKIGPLNLPALGRTMQLGQLWNGHTYQHLGGLSLWSAKTIQERQQIQYIGRSQFSYEHDAQERLKKSNLDVEASLSVGIGIFKLHGSANYLKKNKTSKHEVVVTATCRVETRVRRIPQEILGDIGYAKNLDLSGATHFVAEVTEGGHATMEFRYEAASSEEAQETSGSLKALIPLGSLTIGGEAKVKLDLAERELGERTKVTCFADYPVQANVTTFRRAIDEAGAFPKRLKGATKTMSFLLLPLAYIDSNAFRVCRSIAAGRIQEIQKPLHEMEELTLELKDLKTHPGLVGFRNIRRQVEDFEAAFGQRLTKFKDTLCQLLSQLKGAGNEECDQQLSHHMDLATHQAKVCREFLSFQGEQAQNIQALLRGRMEQSGFTNYMGVALPVRADGGGCLLVDLSEVDEVDSPHGLQDQLDALPASGPKRRKMCQNALLNRWWDMATVRAALEGALQHKKHNEEAGVQHDYWIGLRPYKDGEMEQESNAMLFMHDGSSWQPWGPLPKPQVRNVRVDEHGSALGVQWTPIEGAAKYLVTAVGTSRTESSAQKVEEGEQKVEAMLTGLEPDTEYKVDVHAISPLRGASAPSGACIVRTPRPPSLAQRLVGAHRKGEVAGSEDRVRHTFTTNNVERYQRFKRDTSQVVLRCVDVIPDFIPEEDFGKDEDALVFVFAGETGSGKTTHINAMFNWMMGTHMDDDFRLLLVDDGALQSNGKPRVDQTQSVTQHITLYRVRRLPGMPIRQSVILVDSPGYGDTRGLVADKFVEDTFGAAFGELTHLNCIGIVVNSTQQRLTDKFKMVVNSVLAMFHKEVSENIIPVCTFADHGKPLCLEALREENVPFDVFVKVQNSPFTGASKEDSVGQTRSQQAGGAELARLHWGLAEAGIEQFFKAASDLKIKALKNSSKVLERRQELHETLHMLDGALRDSAGQIGSMVSLISALATTLGCVPYDTVSVETWHTEKVDITDGRKVTLCMKCNVTCHERCGIAEDNKKHGCWAMTNGHCRICKGKCHWTHHHNASYYFKAYKKEGSVVPEALINEWAGSGGTAEGAILKMLEEQAAQQVEVSRLMKLMVETQSHLEAESLRHNPEALRTYVQSLIAHHMRMGASSSMIDSLETAKRALDRSLQTTMQEAIANSKKNVMNKIKVELRRRSQLSALDRAKEESAPSSFYNDVRALLPDTLQAKAPDPVEEQRHGFRYRFPPFATNLNKVGELLSMLLSETM